VSNLSLFFKLNTPSIPTSEGPLGDHAIFARFIAKEYFTTLFRLEVHSSTRQNCRKNDYFQLSHLLVKQTGNPCVGSRNIVGFKCFGVVNLQMAYSRFCTL